VALLVEAAPIIETARRPKSEALSAKMAGAIATSGAVSRLFHRKGQIIFHANHQQDQLIEVALESGAEDFKAERKAMKSS